MRFRFCGDLDCPDWVLSEVATLSKLSSVRIKIVVNQILSFCLAGSFNYEKVMKLIADSPDGLSEMKGAVAALHFIVSNAAKHDVDDLSLVQEIQQLGLPKENSENIGRAYKDHKDSLREKFASESYSLSKMLSVEWRVDQVVAASDETQIGPLVNIKMEINARPQVEDGSYYQDFSFELDGSKLDVLVAELSRAHAIMQSLQS